MKVELTAMSSILPDRRKACPFTVYKEQSFLKRIVEYTTTARKKYGMIGEVLVNVLLSPAVNAPDKH